MEEPMLFDRERPVSSTTGKAVSSAPAETYSSRECRRRLISPRENKTLMGFYYYDNNSILRKTKDCKIKNRQLSIVYSIKIGGKKGRPARFSFFGVGWGKRKEFCVAWCCCVAKEKGYYTDGPRFRIAFVHFRRHFISWGPSMLNTYNAPDASSFIHSLFLSFFLYFSQVTCILFPYDGGGRFLVIC